MIFKKNWSMILCKMISITSKKKKKVVIIGKNTTIALLLGALTIKKILYPRETITIKAL